MKSEKNKTQSTKVNRDSTYRTVLDLDIDEVSVKNVGKDEGLVRCKIVSNDKSAIGSPTQRCIGLRKRNTFEEISLND